MKTTLKSADVAKIKGAGYVKKMVKKQMEEVFEAGGMQFFYDTEFEYGGADGRSPLLYVGELSSEWKKYLKANKKKATFAAGRCKPNPEKPSMLFLEIKLGKGGKQTVLKEVNKFLKPHIEAFFVASLENPIVQTGDLKEIEEVAEDEKNPNVSSLETEATSDDLLKEGKELVQHLASGKTALDALIVKLEPRAKNPSRDIITKDLIKDLQKDLDLIDGYDIQAMLLAVKDWQTGDAKKEKDSNKELSEVYAQVTAAAVAIQSIEGKIRHMIQYINLAIHAVPSAAAGTPPPISKNPAVNFGTGISSSVDRFSDLSPV